MLLGLAEFFDLGTLENEMSVSSTLLGLAEFFDLGTFSPPFTTAIAGAGACRVF